MRRAERWVVGAILAGTSLQSLAGCAGEGSGTGQLRGAVEDQLTGAPIAGALVTAGGVEAVTDQAGEYALLLPEGTHEVVVSAEGYHEAFHPEAVVRGDGTTTLLAPLQPVDPDEAAVEAWLEARDHARQERDDPDDPALRPEVVAFLRGEIDDLRPPLTIDGGEGVAGARIGLASPPRTIRVWRRSIDGASSSCSGRIDVIPFEDYVKGVLPHEWIVSWPDASLRAGALAIRTYSWRWILAGGKYTCADLDDTTRSQVYRDSRVDKATRAVDATRGQGIVRSGSLVSGEYSAENGDPTADGVRDAPCAGRAVYGHGRGMCQWGTSRWASRGYGHEWIATHYWPGSSIAGGCTPSPEVCDGRDNDCDGLVDEGVKNACGTCGPVPVEVCDGRDNDCDGVIDENVCDRASATGRALPELMDLGTRVSRTITLRNDGTTTWRPPAYTVASSATGAGLAVEGGIDGAVAPGGTVAVEVTVTPSAEGDVTVVVGVARDGRRFGTPWRGTTRAARPIFAASIVDLSVPSALRSGDEAAGFAVLRNEGRERWLAGTRLVALDEAEAPAAPWRGGLAEPVGPGEDTRVTLDVTAPGVAVESVLEARLHVQAPDGTLARWPEEGRAVRLEVAPARRAATDASTRPAPGADARVLGGCSAGGASPGSALAWLVPLVALAVRRRRPAV